MIYVFIDLLNSKIDPNPLDSLRTKSPIFQDLLNGFLKTLFIVPVQLAE